MKSKNIIAVFSVAILVLSILIVNAAKLDRILPIPQKDTGKFIMWTDDGENIMWGTYRLNSVKQCNDDSTGCVISNYATGTFKAIDNSGRRSTGTFTKDSFKGYYIGKNKEYSVPFSGTFDQEGNWKARGLFGKQETSGQYKFFKMPIVIQNIIKTP